MNKRDIIKDIADNTKELHGAVNKLGKVAGLDHLPSSTTVPFS